MKRLLFYSFILIALTISSCNTQKIVSTINDAKKLEIYKNDFIDKPLSKVLSEIKPQIKFAYGNPENRSSESIGGTYMTFYFANKEENKKRVSAKDIPTRITIQFQLENTNNRRPFPKDGLTKWTKKETKEYGDMIILNIRVSGEN